jgi:hypothetical protein
LWEDLLARTRETTPSPDVLAWRYLANPQGRALAWVLIDEKTSEIGGFTVVMPRTFLRAGETLRGWVGADFSILPKFRALGPALQLRRAAREAIDRGDADVLVSFPNQRMTLIHERAGHQRLGRLARVARPISVAPQVARRASGAVAGIVAPPIDFARRLSVRLRTRDADVRIAACAVDDLDARFDMLAMSVGQGARIVGLRDAAYLRWRYFGQPGWTGHLLAAERAGMLTGYLVLSERGGAMFVEDLLAIDNAAASSLVGAAAEAAAQAGCVSVSFTSLEGGAYLPVLNSLGFHERPEDFTVYAYVPERHTAHEDASDPSRWYVTVGDRDV